MNTSFYWFVPYFVVGIWNKRGALHFARAGENFMNFGREADDADKQKISYNSDKLEPIRLPEILVLAQATP
jgi:hypothetical protein